MKTIGLKSKTNASARGFYILVRFFAVRCKAVSSNDRLNIGHVKKVDTRRLISFLSLNLNFVLTNSASAQFSHLKQIKQIGAIVK